LRDEIAEEIFAILDNEVAKKIFIYVLNHPNTYPLDIARNIDPPIHHETARYHLDRMRKVGLIEITKDAKIVRIKEGQRAIELKQTSLNHLKDSYVNFLINHLRTGCLYPEILVKNDQRLVLRIDCPDGNEIIMDLQLSEWNLVDFLSADA
jgi:hypothetical protein